jgi:hypothetical protein
MEAELTGDVIRVGISGYPDMPRVHGLTTLGWMQAALSLIGAEVHWSKIVREPWSGASEVLYEFGLAPASGDTTDQ